MDTENISKKIIEFLDGELPQAEEHSLFFALSESDELRNILKEHLAISRSVRNDFSAFVPPSSAIFNIANTLNLKTIGNAVANKPSFFAKYGKKAVLMLSTSILTFLLTFLLINSHGRNNSEPVKAIVQTPPIIIAEHENNTSDDKYLTKQKLNNVSNINPNSYFLGKVSKSSAAVSEQRQQSTSNIACIEPITNNPNNFNEIDRNVSSQYIKPTKLFYCSYPTVNTLLQDKSFVITLRGLTGKSFPNPDVATNEFPSLSNLSCGFYFTQWNNIKFGIEFGRETFGLSYENIENGILFNYEQKPSILWGAVGIDYSIPISFYSPFQPFVTVLAGGTQIGGPLVKGIGGIRYRPANSNFEAYLGAEGTLLFYQNQKIFYLTRKIGLTYGISIIF